MPNIIIEDTRLSYLAKTVATAVYAHSNAFGYCRLGVMQLSRITGCSPATVSRALDKLSACGYIRWYQNYAYSHDHGRLVYSRYTCVCLLATDKNFTLIPRSIFRAGLRHSTFCVYLYLRRVAGNASRAFPSLSAIAGALKMAKATVCRAIKEQVAKGLVYLEHCIKQDGGHTSNSYFFIREAVSTPLSTVKPIIRPLRRLLRKLRALVRVHIPISPIIRHMRHRRKRYRQRGVVSFLRI